MAEKRGIPLYVPCDVCDGEGKVADLFASLFPPKEGEPAPEKEDCYNCQGKGKVSQFFPRYISGMDYEKMEHVVGRALFSEKSLGNFVAIRPCGEEYEGKTYLGIFIGALASSISVKYQRETMKLAPSFSQHNPAIFVFDLKRIIFGYESWWGEIKSPEDLKKITDQDINNVWYVRALDALTKQEETASQPDETTPVPDPT